MDKKIGRTILVTGKVQGVFYRASAVDEANKLGLKGIVKNLPTGQVYIEVFGEIQAVEALIVWSKQGPPMSTVIQVQIEDIPFREESSFRVVY